MCSKKILTFIFIGLLLVSFFSLPFIFLFNKKLAYYAYKEVTYGTIINHLCGKEKDQEKISIRVLNFLHDNLFTPPSTTAVDKDVYNDLIRGIAWCDQKAWALGTFLGRLGIDNRMVMTKNPEGVSNHTISESFINGKWTFFDPYWGIVIYNNYGELVSYKDICNKPSLFYLSPKMSMIKNIDYYSYKKIKEHYTENIFYNNPSEPTIWDNPVKKKDLKRLVITKILDFYIYLFGNKFSFFFQDIYLHFLLNTNEHNLTYLKARNYDLYERYELAIDAYNKFINNYPEDSDIENALLFSGILFNKVKSPNSSINILQLLLERFPNTKWKAIAYYYLGYNYELLKNYNLAEDYYWRTINTYKSYPSYIEFGIKAKETDVIERLSNLLNKPN